ncbi:site-specific integrase [Microbacterium sp. 69-10]|uniref:tyrosine-type recombinase/integrase n=1 Tax=Microbacterium sp. 69-10 TaxID=1895783 RepID=UPI0025D1651C|nr:site-specific integrase [Microbacterium sp. 69-10]
MTVKGKRKYFYFKGVTKSEAARMLRVRLNQRDDGSLPRGKDLTVAAWMRHWVKTADLTPRTRYVYDRTVEAYVVPGIGHIRLSELEPEDLEEFYAAFQAGAFSHLTLNKATNKRERKAPGSHALRNVHANIRAALNVAVKRRRVARNVALAVELPRAEHAEMRTMSTTDARRVIAAAMERPDAARWYLALVYGLRPSELLGLEASHLDRGAGVVRVRQQLARVVGEGMRILPYTKTDAGRRDIPVPEAVIKLIDRAIERRMQMRLEYGARYVEWENDGEPTSLLFTQDDGTPIDSNVHRRAWRELLASVGVPAERPYIGRHTAASVMIEMGMDIAVVSSILGHKKTSFTYDTYVHPMMDAKKSAADALASAYGL